MTLLLKGIDHLGYFIKPDYVGIRHKVVASCHRVVDRIVAAGVPAGSDGWQSWLRTLNTYFGYFGHGASRKIREGIVRRLRVKTGFNEMVKIVPKGVEGCRSFRLRKEEVKQSELETRKAQLGLEKKFKAAFKTGYLKVLGRGFDPKKSAATVRWCLKNWRPCRPVLQCFAEVGAARPDLASGGCSLSVTGDLRAPDRRTRRRRRRQTLTRG